MSPVHVDTGAFIALLWARDRAHERVVASFNDLRQQGAGLLTCDPVIGETATRLRYDAGLEPALRFHDLVQQAVTVGQLHVIESGPELRNAAFELMGRFDGLSLSYADAVGAAAARTHGVDTVLGLDDDFRVLGFRLIPE